MNVKLAMDVRKVKKVGLTPYKAALTRGPDQGSLVRGMGLWVANKEVFVVHRCLPFCITPGTAKGLRLERGGRKKTDDYFSKFFESPPMTFFNYTTKPQGKQ